MRRRSVILRLVERVYVWAWAREQRLDHEANPEWWARMQAYYRRLR